MNLVLDTFNRVNRMFGFSKHSQNQTVRPLMPPMNTTSFMPSLPEKRRDLSCPLLGRNFPVNINAGYMYPPLMNRSLHSFHRFPTTVPRINPTYNSLRLTPHTTLPGFKIPSALFATAFFIQKQNE